jgi:exopolysaccharide biosynthesis polyprenyl glycosylphosphotransferase
VNSSRSGFLAVAAMDVALVNAGMYLAFHMRFEGNIPKANIEPFIRLIPFISIVLLVLFWSFRLYSPRMRRYSEIIYSIGLCVVILNILSATMTFFARGFTFPRSVLIISGFIEFGLLAIWRCIFQYVLESTDGFKTVAIVGQNGEMDDVFADRLRHLIGKKYEIGHILTGDETEELDSAIENSDIVCLNSMVPQEIKERVMGLCLELDKGVILIPSIYEIMMHNVTMDNMEDVPVFRIEPLQIQPVYQLLKRVLDISVSAVGLVVMSPLFILLAVLIRLDSPGPIFYRQLRVGLAGSQFKVIKFRTMVNDAEKITGPVLASEHDPRITKMGKFLRKSRLDEFPQLINVLKGDMSLVGPRPERPFFVDQFTCEIPGYIHRLKVKPGITGLAQIMGRYDTDPEDKLRYDLYYIKNYSPLLDIQMILQTLRIPFEPNAAQGVSERGPVVDGQIKLPGK